MNKLISFIIKCLILILLIFPCFFLVSCSNENNEKDSLLMNSFYSNGNNVVWNPNHLIKHVHDGDTFTDESNNVYRLFSVDTPEITTFTFNHKNESTKGLEHLWAQKAADFAQEAILNKRVMVINKTKDVYHRFVSAIFYIDESGDVKNLAMELLRNGLARIAFISKTNKMFNVDSSFFDYMQAIEEKAREKRKGFFKYDSLDYWTIFPKQNVGI